jgi:hypothetical protein
MGDRLSGGIRQVVDWQNDDVITYTDATVVATISPEGCGG